MRLIAILATAAMLAGGVGPGLAQDTGESPAESDTTLQTPAPEAEPAADDAGEDVFIPSEEVEADTAVAFPTDI